MERHPFLLFFVWSHRDIFIINIGGEGEEEEEGDERLYSEI